MINYSQIIARFSVAGLRLRLHFQLEVGTSQIKENHILRAEVESLQIIWPEVEKFPQNIEFSDWKLRISPRHNILNILAARLLFLPVLNSVLRVKVISLH
jgi:hypothetical protein